jgi:hypothetical protein
MRRVLKCGGQLLVLEFSKPTSTALESLYDAYSFRVLPALGRIVAGDADSYRYLAESIRRHPDQETLLAMMQGAGLEDCRYHNLTGGIVAGIAAALLDARRNQRLPGARSLPRAQSCARSRPALGSDQYCLAPEWSNGALRPPSSSARQARRRHVRSPGLLALTGGASGT